MRYKVEKCRECSKICEYSARIDSIALKLIFNDDKT